MLLFVLFLRDSASYHVRLCEVRRCVHGPVDFQNTEESHSARRGPGVPGTRTSSGFVPHITSMVGELQLRLPGASLSTLFLCMRQAKDGGLRIGAHKHPLRITF